MSILTKRFWLRIRLSSPNWFCQCRLPVCWTHGRFHLFKCNCKFYCRQGVQFAGMSTKHYLFLFPSNFNSKIPLQSFGGRGTPETSHGMKVIHPNLNAGRKQLFVLGTPSSVCPLVNLQNVTLLLSHTYHLRIILDTSHYEKKQNKNEKQNGSMKHLEESFWKE